MSEIELETAPQGICAGNYILTINEPLSVWSCIMTDFQGCREINLAAMKDAFVTFKIVYIGLS